MNVVVAGLTAAGKTTHALLLAEHLGYRYVSASQILARVVGFEVSSPTESWWLGIGNRISAARSDRRIDLSLDEEMCRLADEQDQQVFDAWALPWTSDQPMFRIWLESDVPSRRCKCYVSHLPDPPSLAACGELIERKDQQSREIFRELHGFDLMHDHEVFDLIVDVSGLIAACTRQASDAGIARLDPVLTEACLWQLDHAGGSQTAFSEAAELLPNDALLRAPAGGIDNG